MSIFRSNGQTSLLQSVTADGVINAGASMVSFENTGSTDATVAGGTLESGKSVTFRSGSNKTLDSILYEASETAPLNIASVR